MPAPADRVRKRDHMRRKRAADPEKVAEYQREWRKKNRERVNAYNKAYRERLTPAYAAKKERDRIQSRIRSRKRYGIVDPPTECPTQPCEICGETLKLVCDHDHATGLFRGWLCRRCNVGIGALKDSAELCEKAATYLRRQLAEPLGSAAGGAMQAFSASASA